MTFKNWIIDHYFKDRDDNIRNIALKLFYIAFFTFIIVSILFFTNISLLSTYINIKNVCEISILPVSLSIKWYHYVLFGLGLICFLYWIDYGYYLVNKYRKLKGV